MPKPSFRRWLSAWGLAVGAAALVGALATGAYAVSQAQLMGFGTPIPFTEKPLSLMARQFAGGFLWGGAASIVFAVPGVTAAVGLTSLRWTFFVTAAGWIWLALGSGLGLLLVFPVFGAATGLFAEAVGVLAGAAALGAARRRLCKPMDLHPPS